MQEEKFGTKKDRGGWKLAWARKREFLMGLEVRATKFSGVDVLDCLVLRTEIQLVVVADPQEQKDAGATDLVAHYRALYGDAVGCLSCDADVLGKILTKGVRTRGRPGGRCSHACTTSRS